MLRTTHIKIRRHTLKIVIVTVFLGLAGFAIASMGGEKRNRKTAAARTDFAPVKTTAGFTLKAGAIYKGSMLLNQEKVNGQLHFNSLVTFQRGNTTYILPLNHRVNIGSTRASDNLQMLRLKVRMHK
jgi:hypothetical protein